MEFGPGARQLFMTMKLDYISRHSHLSALAVGCFWLWLNPVGMTCL